ncbi:unnamed protein product [Alternaria alternata]
MRLLQLQDDASSFSLVEFQGNKIPPYAILSHTWDPRPGKEVTYQDLLNGAGKEKTGSYRKLTFCMEQAAKDGLRFFWVDTCCIDKSSSAELSEAITSMFRWYRNSAKCYVFMSDVSVKKRKADCNKFYFAWEPAFRMSRWFSRGWTLQELLAPPVVTFFSNEATFLGDKSSLEQQIHQITQIPVLVLRGASFQDFSIEDRMLWSKKRQTTREEDEAYSLLGIFNTSMLPMYGEGKESAFRRLRNNIQPSPHGERNRLLLESLGFDQIHTRETTIKNAHSETCTWFAKTSKYIDWLDPDKLKEHHGLLWIKGKPGTGKSTLMKFVLDRTRKKTPGEVVISFFFNRRGESIVKSTIGAYRSLLLQLLKQQPALQCVLDLVPLSASSPKKYQWEVELLKTLFEQAIKKLGDASVVCFIDALDECEEEQIRDMVRLFERIGESAVAAQTRFRVCFSSRYYPHVTIRTGLTLELDGEEGHREDIQFYLESELEIGQSELTERIRAIIRKKASGVFMWVVLVIRILNKEYDHGRIHTLWRTLQDIPSDLHDLLGDIVSRDLHSREDFLLCIRWVLFAEEPLTPEQLYAAILAGSEPREVPRWDTNVFTRDVAQRFVLSASRGLIEFTASEPQKVQLIHESVRDFVLKDGLGDVWPDLRTNFRGESHEQLKRCCMKCTGMNLLSDPDVRGGSSSPLSSEHESLETSVMDANPFLGYAITYVLFHSNAAQKYGVTQTSFLDGFPLPKWIELAKSTRKFKIYAKSHSLEFILAQLNYTSLIELRSNFSTYLKAESGGSGSPLFAAVAHGSKEAFHLCMAHLQVRYTPEECTCVRDARVDKHAVERHGNLDPLFIYSENSGMISNAVVLGNKQVLALLLDMNEFPIDLPDTAGRTPLWLACKNGCEAMVKLLLDREEVNINSKDFHGQTPLHIAAATDHCAAMKLLLDKGAIDVESKDNFGQTPLLRAAQNGHWGAVNFLLTTARADINSEDRNKRTALWWAARFGHINVVYRLLESGMVEVDYEDENGQTPLSRAVMSGYDEVVEHLRRYTGDESDGTGS